MGLFSGAAKGGGNNDFRDRLMAAISVMQGDPNAAFRLAEQRRQNQELLLRQQAAQRTEQDRADQVWGAKESGVGNPLISALSPSDLSQTLRERYAPHSVSPNATYVTPSLTPGGQDATYTAPAAPTTEQQNYGWLQGIQGNGPSLASGYARRQAYGPDVTVAPGGSVATHDDAGNFIPGIQAYSASPAAQGAPTAGATGHLTDPGSRAPMTTGPFAGWGVIGVPGDPRARAGGATVPHNGVDFAPPPGRPELRTDRPVTITRVLPDHGISGITAIAQFDDGTQFNLMHLAAPPRLGRYNAGDVIATAGNTGNARGGSTQIHVQPWGGRNTDPRQYFGGGGAAPRSATRSPVANAPRQPVQVNSPQEAAALPPGTPFRTHDGRLMVRQ